MIAIEQRSWVLNTVVAVAADRYAKRISRLGKDVAQGAQGRVLSWVYWLLLIMKFSPLHKTNDRGQWVYFGDGGAGKSAADGGKGCEGTDE